MASFTIVVVVVVDPVVLFIVLLLISAHRGHLQQSHFKSPAFILFKFVGRHSAFVHPVDMRFIEQIWT